MLNDAKVQKLLQAIADGPICREIEKQAEDERAARCTALRGELDAGQAAYVRDLEVLQHKHVALAARVAALKAELAPLDKEHLKLLWLIGDKRGAMTEHRDRYWAELATAADPRIAVYRREFEGRLRACEGLVRTWQTGPARSVFERPPTANNMAAINRAGQYLLDAIDACTRWAREGIQGQELVSVYQGTMDRFPRIPMAKDDPGVIPEPHN